MRGARVVRHLIVASVPFPAGTAFRYLLTPRNVGQSCPPDDSGSAGHRCRFGVALPWPGLGPRAVACVRAPGRNTRSSGREFAGRRTVLSDRWSSRATQPRRLDRWDRLRFHPVPDGTCGQRSDVGAFRRAPRGRGAARLFISGRPSSDHSPAARRAEAAQQSEEGALDRPQLLGPTSQAELSNGG